MFLITILLSAALSYSMQSNRFTTPGAPPYRPSHESIRRHNNVRWQAYQNFESEIPTSEYAHQAERERREAENRQAQQEAENRRRAEEAKIRAERKEQKKKINSNAQWAINFIDYYRQHPDPERYLQQLEFIEKQIELNKHFHHILCQKGKNHLCGFVRDEITKATFPSASTASQPDEPDDEDALHARMELLRRMKKLQEIRQCVSSNSSSGSSTYSTLKARTLLREAIREQQATETFLERGGYFDESGQPCFENYQPAVPDEDPEDDEESLGEFIAEEMMASQMRRMLFHRFMMKQFELAKKRDAEIEKKRQCEEEMERQRTFQPKIKVVRPEDFEQREDPFFRHFDFYGNHAFFQQPFNPNFFEPNPPPPDRPTAHSPANATQPESHQAPAADVEEPRPSSSTFTRDFVVDDVTSLFLNKLGLHDRVLRKLPGSEQQQVQGALIKGLEKNAGLYRLFSYIGIKDFDVPFDLRGFNDHYAKSVQNFTSLTLECAEQHKLEAAEIGVRIIDSLADFVAGVGQGLMERVSGLKDGVAFLVADLGITFALTAISRPAALFYRIGVSTVSLAALGVIIVEDIKGLSEAIYNGEYYKSGEYAGKAIFDAGATYLFVRGFHHAGEMSKTAKIETPPLLEAFAGAVEASRVLPEASSRNFDFLPLSPNDKDIFSEAWQKLKEVPGFDSPLSPFTKIFKASRQELKPGNLANIKGYMYEIEAALKLFKDGVEILGIGEELSLSNLPKREFDIILKDSIIDCKNWQWPSAAGDNSLKKTFGDQLKMVLGHGKKLVILSKNEIPVDWKLWFNKKNISFKENF